MALRVSTTGNGALGNIEPGWSEQEFSTPVSAVERAGGTGTVSLSAQDAGEGVLIIENGITSTDDALGAVEGVVRSVSWTGNRISVTHDNKLARYNATRNMPPMGSASLPGCLNLAEQMLGGVLFTRDAGAYWSLFGHGAGFDPNGERIQASTRLTGGTTLLELPGTATIIPNSGTYNRVAPSNFSVVDDVMYAGSILGSTLGPAQSGSAVNLTRMSCKVALDGGDWQVDIEGGPFNANAGWGFEVSILIDYSAETISFSGDATVGGAPFTPISGSTSLSPLDLDEELALSMDWGDGTGRAQMNFRICNVSDYATYVEFLVDTETFTPNCGPFTITGNTRAFWMWEDPASTAFQTPSEWESDAPYVVDGAITLGEPAIGFSGSVWDWLQDACTVYRWEVGLDGDDVTTRAIGGRTLDISNYEGVPTVNPTTTRTGRSIDVTYQGGEIVSGALVYEAREDDNRILSVGANQTTTTAINTNAYLTDVIQPVRTTGFIPGVGTYYVIDSTGLPIVVNQWEDFGGAVQVSLDPDQPGVINVTLTGPDEIPSTSPPYSLAVSDGENQYAALSILGSGVVGDPRVQNILTGADPSKTPEEVGAAITGNAFINTREQAFDTGIWVTVDVSGPKITLDITVPSRALDGFGLTAGSVIYWRDNAYRVDSATVRSLSTSITASRFFTVGMFDSVWGGVDVNLHDTTWAPYETIDQRVLTLKGSDFLVPASLGFGLDPFGLTPFGE